MKRGFFIGLGMASSLVATSCNGGSVPVSQPEIWHKTASGLEYTIIKPGKGSDDDRPAPFDECTIRYTIDLPSGTNVRRTRTKPEKYVVGTWMLAFSEGVQLMRPGARFRFKVPARLARDKGGPIKGFPVNRDIIFEMMLVSALKVPPFRKLDANATRTSKGIPGLRYQVIAQGEGDPPGPEDTVEVAYTYWNPEGQQLETSYYSGKPLRGLARDMPIALFKVAPRLMKAGSKVLFEAPYRLTFARDRQYAHPGLKRGQRSYWLLELEKIIRPLPVPDFVEPDEAKLQSTASGFKYEVIEPGEGSSPKPFEAVRVHYAGWTADGKLFDSSYQGGEVSTLVLPEMIKGVREGLLLAKPGGKYRFVVPPELGYGKAGKPPKIGPDETLIFFVDVKAVTMPPGWLEQLEKAQTGQNANAPPPGATPPPGLMGAAANTGITQRRPLPDFVLPAKADTQATSTGLRYEVVRPGNGPEPKGGNVKIHFAHWLQDGTLIESSFEHGMAFEVALNAMIPGCREGVLLMKPGAAYRFVIPGRLAFGARGIPNKKVPPHATIVSYIELLGDASAVAPGGAPKAGPNKKGPSKKNTGGKVQRKGKGQRKATRKGKGQRKATRKGKGQRKATRKGKGKGKGQRKGKGAARRRPKGAANRGAAKQGAGKKGAQQKGTQKKGAQSGPAKSGSTPVKQGGSGK